MRQSSQRTRNEEPGRLSRVLDSWSSILQAVLNPADGADDDGVGVAIRIDDSFYFYIASVAQYWMRLGHNGDSPTGFSVYP